MLDEPHTPKCYHKRKNDIKQEPTVAAMTIRNISDHTHTELKARAVRNGRSTEAEVRAILEASLAPMARKGMGTALADIGQAIGGIELEITRDKSPARVVAFE